MRYTDTQRIIKIIENAEKLNEYIKNSNITKQDLLDNYTLQWLVTTPLLNIGEHTFNLTEGFKNNHPQIPWNRITGLRHRLVHDYEGTNWNIIAEILLTELPQLIVELKNIKIE